MDISPFFFGIFSVLAVACSLMMVFKKNRWLSLFFLLTPFATAFARMHWDRHWFSDTAGSMILGIMWSFFLCGYEQYRRTMQES